MTNHEKYKKAFSVLQTSESSFREVENMARLQKRTKMKTAAAVIAGCILLGGTGTAYAANVGGIQRTIQLWIHGDQTNATLNVSDNGTYTMEYYDENGELQESGGGGIAFEADGTQRSVWVYYHNQSIDITNKFNDNKVCFVKIADGDKTLYLTVKYQNGFSYSNEKYVEPEEFN